MELVYLETTFISYLVARPSRDLLVAAHQQSSQDWWADRSPLFGCFASPVVIEEASVGDATEVQKRLAILKDLPILEVTDEARLLAKAILKSGAIPMQAARDAAHIAVAAIHEIDYLLTWNCRHLANARLRDRIEVACSAAGYRAPTISTPEELLDEAGYVD